VADQLPTHADGTGAGVSGSPPDPEVTPRPRRRNFPPAYKAALLAELDNCVAGEVGAILRREGVYSSSISTWRQQRQDGQLGTAKRGPKALVPVKSVPANSEAQQLRRENRRLKRELETALLAIEIQKKVSQLMEIQRRNDESSLD